MEIRIAAEGTATEEEHELLSLSRIGVALRALPEALRPRPDVPGVVALGHGGPDGVSDGRKGAQGTTFVLTPGDAAQLQGGWVYALACNTAPELATRLVLAGLWRAAGHNEALRLPDFLRELEQDRLNVIAEYVLAIAKAAIESNTEADRGALLAREIDRVFDAVSPRPHEFMLDGFLEQLASTIEVRESASTKTASD